MPQVAEDECRHFTLLCQRLEELGSHYGAFPAHDGCGDLCGEDTGCHHAVDSDDMLTNTRGPRLCHGTVPGAAVRIGVELQTLISVCSCCCRLWESATTTAGSLPARLAVEHCCHEARGLDVLPSTIAKFRNNGDEATAALLETVVYPVSCCLTG